MVTTKKILVNVFVIGIIVVLSSFDLPAGWFKAGSLPESYDMGIDRGAGMDGKNAATIKSIDKKLNGYFGTLMQNCLPDKFLGKRVRMSGFLKTKEVSEWSGLWLRIDGKSRSESLGFDNMHDGKTDRSVKGTSEWTKYSIVLDVPLDATNMGYGALLVGTGQIWFDNLSFEIVDTNVPTTGIQNNIMPNNEPLNTDFEK